MPRKRNPVEMTLVSFYVPSDLLEKMDELVKRGIFPHRNEVVRTAIRELLYRYKAGGQPATQEGQGEGAPASR